MLLQTHQGLIGSAIVLLDLWAIFSVVTSGRALSAKFGWTALILLLPVLGFIFWLISGPRASSTI